MAETVLRAEYARKLPAPRQIEQYREDCEERSEEDQLPDRHAISRLQQGGHGDENSNGSDFETDAKHRVRFKMGSLDRRARMSVHNAIP